MRMGSYGGSYRPKATTAIASNGVGNSTATRLVLSRRSSSAQEETGNIWNSLVENSQIRSTSRRTSRTAVQGAQNLISSRVNSHPKVQ